MNRTHAEQERVGSNVTDSSSGGSGAPASERVAGGLRRLTVGLVVLALVGLPLAGAVTAQSSANASLSVSAPDSVEPGETVQVTYTVTHDGDEKSGYFIEDALPDGWSYEDVASQTANGSVAYSAERNTIVIIGYFQPGDTGSVTLNVTAPADASGTATFSPTATDGADTQANASATVEIESTEELSVFEAIDANDDGKIGLTELLSATEMWRNSEAVPGTGGETISLTELLEITQSWRNGSAI